MNLENLNKKETETYNILVRLGDSPELAYKTVIADREKPDNYDSYYEAYCL